MNKLLVMSPDGDFEVLLSTGRPLAVGTKVHMSGGVVFVIEAVNFIAETGEISYETTSDLPREFFSNNGYREVLPCCIS